MVLFLFLLVHRQIFRSLIHSVHQLSVTTVVEVLSDLAVELLGVQAHNCNGACDYVCWPRVCGFSYILRCLFTDLRFS